MLEQVSGGFNCWALGQDTKGGRAHPMSMLSGGLGGSGCYLPEAIASWARSSISMTSLSAPNRLLGGVYSASPLDSRTHSFPSSSFPHLHWLLPGTLRCSLDSLVTSVRQVSEDCHWGWGSLSPPWQAQGSFWRSQSHLLPRAQMMQGVGQPLRCGASVSTSLFPPV